MNLTPNTRALSFNHLSLPYLRAFVGLTLIFLSLYATINFLSQGFSGAAFLGIVIFCVAIEAIKILSSGDIGFYLALKAPEKALLAFAIVTFLFFLSVGAETWFLMSGGLKESTQVEQSSKQFETLKEQITAKEAQLAACNPSSLTKCVNPRTAELTNLQDRLTELTASSTVNEEALSNQKFWEQIATATGASAENLKLGLNVVRAIAQEFFGLYFLGQFSAWKRLQTLEKAGYDYEPEAPVRREKEVREAAPAPMTEQAPVRRRYTLPPSGNFQETAKPRPSAENRASAENLSKPGRAAPNPTAKSRQTALLNYVDRLEKTLAELEGKAKPTTSTPSVSMTEKEMEELDALLSEKPEAKTSPKLDMSRLSVKS